MNELARATNLGSTGWVDLVAYDFTIEFTTTSLKIFVDSVLEIDILAANVGDGTAFDSGNFAFYNYSQPNVRYNAVTQDVIPEPTSSSLAVAALLSCIALIARRRTRC